MKKIFFIWLIFLSFITLVKAETIYSDYSKCSGFTDEKVDESDTVKVLTERRYKYYSEEKILGDYYKAATIVKEFPQMDLDDYYETEFSNWSNINPGFSYGRIIETRKVYEIKDRVMAHYLQLYNVTGGNLSVKELEIYYKDKKIDYRVINENDFGLRLHDNNYSDTTNNNIPSLTTINLKNDYNPEDITIKAYLYDNTENTKYFYAKFTSDEDVNSYTYAILTMMHWFNNSVSSNNEPFIYTTKDYAYKSPKYVISYSENEPISKDNRTFSLIEQYRYKDTLYRYYLIENKYLEGYYKDNPGNYLKDEKQYKDYYCFKTRDKVVLNSNLEITNYNQGLDDLIISSTTDNINIDGEFNINKNGNYKVNVILPFKTITKTIKVNILQNEINETNEKLLVIEKKLKESKELLNTKKADLKNLKEKLNQSELSKSDIKKYHKQIKTLETDVDGLLKKIDTLESKKEKYNEQMNNLLKEKNYSILDNLKWWLWLVIIVLAIIITIMVLRLRKMSYQN